MSYETNVNTYLGSQDERGQDIDYAFEAVEAELTNELTKAECIEDVYEDLHHSLDVIIEEKHLCIEADDVIPYFIPVYGLKEA